MIKFRLLQLLALTLFVPALAFADAPLIDGEVWMVSSESEKEAYLVGVGNLMTVEYVVQQEAENSPTTDQTAIPDLWQGISEQSINGLVKAVDDWYKANPDSLDRPVLVVIWRTFVEPEE